MKTISHNGFNYSFNYDNFGNVTQTKVGSQVLSTNTYGNNNGDLKQVEYGNGNKIGYTYDDYGNISTISQDGDTNFKWQYDSTGNLYAHDDLVNNQRFVYTYDSTGRLVRQQVLDNSKKNIYSSQYGYDLNNNVSRFTSSAGSVSVTENFEYGKDNLASKYTYPSGKTATYTYDGILRRNSTVINTTAPIQQTYKYMASARGNNAQTTKIEEEILGGNSYKYTYDANGNITSVLLKKSTESAYTKQQQFAYDELNQLIRADDLAKNRTEVYNYDNGGNILSTTIYPLTWGSLSGVTAIKTESYTYGDSNWKDKLTAYGNSQITYDEIGNPLTYRGYTLTWQNGRQLASMQLKQMRIEFTYDVDGLRTSKTIPNVGLEHKYYYVGNRLQYETLGGSSALWYFYDADGNPSGIRYKDNSGTVNDYYFVCNWRGDVIQIYNASGTLVGSYTYDAWGRVTENSTDKDTQNIAEINPIRYRGYYYDTETRLYYLKSRYYDPAVKRFLNADGLISTGIEDVCKNMFAYCNNDSVNMADSSGKDPVPAWALHIISGTATESEYAEALSVNPNAWSGSAGYRVRHAIDIAKKRQQNLLASAEHHKRGTTNKANKQKHEKGQTRKQKDKNGEKGDARRKPNPNKRRTINIEIDGDSLSTVFEVTAITVTTTILVGVILDDATGVGVIDDVLIAPLMKILWDLSSNSSLME